MKKIPFIPFLASLFLAILCSLPLGLFAQQQDWIRLWGSAGEKQVRLYWETQDWPQELQGFRVKRRSPRESWQPLHPGTLAPNTSTQKDWAQLGLNPQQAQTTAARLKVLLAEGMMEEMEAAQMLAILQGSGGFEAGDRIRLRADFQLVLGSSLGYVDNDYRPGKSWEYGVFAVFANETESPAPLSIYTPQALRKGFELEPAFSRLRKGVQLSWTLDRRLYEGYALQGFEVYRKNPDSDSLHTLTVTPIGYSQRDSATVTLLFTDTEADKEQDYLYSLAAVDYFQQVYEKSTHRYEAQRYRPLPPPEISSLDLEGERDVRISWELNGDDANRVLGYVVERKMAGKGDFAAVSDTLEAELSSWVDNSDLQYGVVYEYRLQLLSRYGQVAHSLVEMIYYLGQTPPPPARSLQGEVIRRGTRSYIRLRWETASDGITAGYLIFSDELEPGVLRQLSSLPLITEGEVELPVYRGGRTYLFEVVAVTQHGFRSVPAEIAIAVPLLEMPPIGTVTLSTGPEGGILCEWQYPELEGLQGFQLFVNNRLLAGLDSLGRERRAYVMADPQPDRSGLCRVQLQAVGEKMFSERSLERSYRVSLNKMAALPAPKDLKVQLVKEGKEQYAELSWKATNLDSAGIAGFVLAVDYASEGAVMQLSSLPLIRESSYRYRLPEGKRSRYTFRLAAMDSSRKSGPYSEVILDLKKKD